MRLSRLVGIITILLNREKITCGELASFFEVSLRTIYRDIEELSMAGIPIITTPGQAGGVGIMETFRLNHQTFTPQELETIITGLMGLSSGLPGTQVNQTLEKIKTLSESHPSPKAASKVVVDLQPWGVIKGEKDRVEALLTAIGENRQVHIEYINAQDIRASRRVEPLRLILKGTVWYLYAFCLLREEYRLFRVSRISQLDLLEDEFPADKHQITGTPWSVSGVWGEAVHILLRFHPQNRRKIAEMFGDECLIEEEDGWLLLDLTWPIDDWVISFILGFGSAVEVLAPEGVRERVADEVRKMAEHYREP